LLAGPSCTDKRRLKKERRRGKRMEEKGKSVEGRREHCIRKPSRLSEYLGRSKVKSN
jgi:hypothetical protein